MLILIDGSDCSGKTTLAGRLLDRMRSTDPTASVTYHHAGPPTEHPLDEYVEPLLGYRPGTGQHVVCDRWHVGESVYPTVVGRPSELTDGVRTYVEQFLRSRGALLAYCTASPRHLTACGDARGDAAAEIARVGPTVRAFDAAVATSLLPHVAVDVTDPDDRGYDRVVETIVDAARRSDVAARRLAPFVTYVGPPRPALLLVGDRRGVPSTELADHGDWPAFVPRSGTSGTYLLDTLTSTRLTVREHGLQLGDVGLVNACDVDDVRACWEALGRPTTVGMGVNARRALRAADVPHRSAVHPQFQRRFLHHSRATYLRQLLSVELADVIA